MLSCESICRSANENFEDIQIPPDLAMLDLAMAKLLSIERRCFHQIVMLSETVLAINVANGSTLGQKGVTELK